MALNDFHVSEPYTLGIELEMQVINPPGYDLSQDSSTLIDAVKPQLTAGEIKHDITESMLEMATGVCRDIDQAAAQLSAMQHVILQAASEHHLGICGGGTHPFQKWQRQEVCDNERYQRTLENFGYLIQQATVFGYISWGLNHPARHRAIRQLAVSEKLTKETEQRADDMFPELRDLCHRSVLMVFMSDEYRAFGDGLFLALAETTMDFAARDPARAGEYIALGFEAMWRALTREEQ